MAKTRAQRESEFRAEHGVSSGTYYEMRRKAESAGISPKTFDRIVTKTGNYSAAKTVAQTAREGKHYSTKLGRDVFDVNSIARARYEAGVTLGIVPANISYENFDAFDYSADDYDWWYH